MPPVVQGLRSVGFLPATDHLRLAIGLPLRDTAVLDDFLRQVYDPASPNYRQYLTPEQFTEQFGPTEQDYQKVIAFAQANGLTVTATHGNRVLLDVSGPVAAIERAFHVTLRLYQHPHENRKFYAPDTEPSVDLDVPLADISGLNNYSLPHPKNIKVSLSAVVANATPKAGSGPGGAYVGTDFRNAYAPGTTLDGAGQMVGLVQFDGFYSNDIVAYEDLLPGSPRVPLQTVLLDGFDGVPTPAGNLEVSLDIEMAIAMAPGLSKIVVFEGNPASFIPNDVLNSMAASNMVKNLSCSWGWTGGPDTTTENIFLQMAAQGQSFFNASGDGDAFTPGQVDDVNFTGSPSSSPNITQVGGTTLTMTGTGATYASETVWNRNNGTGSSGGISTAYAIPAWQQGISMTANHGSTANRNIPDVAMTAERVFVKYGNGLNVTNVGGTSVAAPLWAGFMALVNQRAAAAGNQPVGFINPAVYALGKGPNYNFYFHDTTTGNNFSPGSPTNFPATTGYDLCTGWGTPANPDLINALAIPNPLLITPLTGFVSAGPVGGPFSVTSQMILITNTSGVPINWALSSPAAWLTAAPSGGTLAAGGKTNVTVMLTAAASTLTTAAYSTSFNITNLAGGIVQTIPFALQIGQPLVSNGGFETGDFTGWTLANSSSFDGVVDSLILTPHTGTFCFAFGHQGAFTFLSQTLATTPGQSYLLSFWLSKEFTGTPDKLIR
ncbi:MAG: protease pro-enzyme activation domain-containing protein [Verrucomicrobiales bacterium]|nr:protease pro-enzyme activation domain-containing protein [Verrucomicrobiales bacterium]